MGGASGSPIITTHQSTSAEDTTMPTSGEDTSGNTPVKAEVNLDQAQEDAQRRLWFSSVVEKKMKIPNGYVKVTFVVIRWDEALDDFGGPHTIEVSSGNKNF